MMKKRFLSIFFMCLAVYTSTSLLTAQNVELDLGFCGTNELSPDMRTWLGNHQQNPDKPNYRNYKNGNYEYLPVQFHVVGDSQGEGYFPRTSMYRLLCEVNDQFSESDLQFFMYDDFNYLNNDDWYEHNFGQGYEMMDANNVDDVINIYMVDDPAGNCGYFSPSVDGIAVAKMCADAGSGTTAHEIGHYLSMPHTFSGWEGHDYFTDPINENQWEKVDGSNCLFRGDGFCDTPPDYVSDRWNCPYTLDLFDTNGEPVNPDGTLYMSYSNDGCSARFSEEQKDAMLAYVYEVRSYLLNADVPEIESVQNTYAHFPASGTQEVPYENVLLTWKAAEGASEYYLNLKQFAEEEGISVQTTVTDTFYVVTLTPDVQYYYWVKPLNAGNTCGEQGEGNFTTSSTSVLYASNVEVSMVGCHEGNDGFVLVEMEGGTPPY
ncbi:MAG: M43 family zinc metalloprotease, partial [Chitinophagales bacterium]